MTLWSRFRYFCQQVMPLWLWQRSPRWFKYWLGGEQGGIQKGVYYTRSGSCHGCGECCTNIYLVHHGHTIMNVEEFDTIKTEDHEFAYFSPVGQNEHGVQFRCKHLQANRRCGIYEDRPLFCRKYPSENGVLLGATLAHQCGYRFTANDPFNAVLGRKTQALKTQPLNPHPPALRKIAAHLYRDNAEPLISHTAIAPHDVK